MALTSAQVMPMQLNVSSTAWITARTRPRR
eukprot:COSAG04_NODE_218_length_19866_cov_12.840969_5_plen_30_part_00